MINTPRQLILLKGIAHPEIFLYVGVFSGEDSSRRRKSEEELVQLSRAALELSSDSLNRCNAPKD